MLRAGLWHRNKPIIVNVDPPGAGKDWVVQVPTTPEGVWWRLKSIVFTLLTDATAGNRQVTLYVGDSADGGAAGVRLTPGGAYAGICSGFQEQPNRAYHYVYGEDQGHPFDVGTGAPPSQVISISLPHDFRVAPGHFIGTFTRGAPTVGTSIGGTVTALAAGDSFVGIRLCVEEWIYEPAGETAPNAGDGSNRVDFVKLDETLGRLAKVLETLQSVTATP